MNFWRVMLLAAACLGWFGCREELETAPARPSSPPPAAAGGEARFDREFSPKEPQPKLPVVQLFIGNTELTAEVARRPLEIQTGMMWRTNMAEMEGMLFVFPRPSQVSFWMRNTLLPLSCAYINPEGVILELHDMKPLDETGIPSGSDQIQYVLEVNQGWFDRHNIKPGMTVGTQHGTLARTFFRR